MSGRPKSSLNTHASGGGGDPNRQSVNGGGTSSVPFRKGCPNLLAFQTLSIRRTFFRKFSR